MAEPHSYKNQNDALLPAGAELLSDKDGIRVLRVDYKGGTGILKLFDSPQHLREITNYALLQELGIPTLQIYERFPSALLMEDLASSPRLRLATPTDLEDPALLQALAAWYRLLHSSGLEAIKNPQHSFYSESSLVTLEGLAWIPQVTQTQSWPIWKRLSQVWPRVQAHEAALTHTLTYNDFSWVNLAVAPDKSAAVMFDYNFLGRGLPTSDLRNVLAGLPPVSQPIFQEAYGAPDPAEALVENLYSPLVSLMIGLRRPVRPRWLDEVWEDVKAGALEHALEALLQQMEEDNAPHRP